MILSAAFLATLTATPLGSVSFSEDGATPDADPAQAVVQDASAKDTGAQETEVIEFFRPEGPAVEPVAETTVGMRVEIEELVIPGSAVQVKPVADPGRADAILRIKHEYTHGTGFRYDLEVTPFIEGEIDLRDFLERKDGSSMEGTPEMPVLVEALLPLEVLTPKDPDVPQPDLVGGYRKLLIGAGIFWAIGLVALIFGFRRRREPLVTDAGQQDLSLADRLRPLVEEARRSELSSERQAELERLLLAHWRERKGLDGMPAARAVATLRADEEAGPLLRQLEAWLHRPASANASDVVDVSALLAPYQNVVTPPPNASRASGAPR